MEENHGPVVMLDDYRPHLVIPTLDGNAHVLPVALVEDWIEGRQEIASGEEWQPVIRAILAEWLESVKKSNPDGGRPSWPPPNRG